MGNGERVIL